MIRAAHRPGSVDGRLPSMHDEITACIEKGFELGVRWTGFDSVAAYFEAIAESINTEQAVRFRSFEE